jgi:DNA-binding transcriptional ArsR family regulator
MTEQDPRFVDQSLVKALAHPLRVRILDLLNEREASPKGISDELDAPLSNVSYHTSVLVDCACVEPTRTEQRRGAVEHFFRAVPRSQIGHQDWRKVPRSVRSPVTASTLQSFMDKAVAALKAGTIDDSEDTTLNWMALSVDKAGRAEAAAILAEAQTRLQEAHDRSRERVAASGEKPTPLIVALAAFEAAPTRRDDEGNEGPRGGS